MSVVISSIENPKLARIGYDNVLRGITPTVSSTENGFFAGALRNSLTNELWKPESGASLPATIEWALSNVSMDYIGIAAHNFGTNSASIKITYSTDGGSNYTAICEGGGTSCLTTVSPTDDSAIMILFDTLTGVTNLKFSLSWSGDDPAVGVIYAGTALVMQRPIYGGHSPITLSRRVSRRPQAAEAGQWLGRSIIRRGFESSISWSNLEAAWYRANFDPFVKSAERYPFFLAWKPEDFPDEVALCWCNDDIKPGNSGIRDLMDVSLGLQGYGVDT